MNARHQRGWGGHQRHLSHLEISIITINIELIIHVSIYTRQRCSEIEYTPREDSFGNQRHLWSQFENIKYTNKNILEASISLENFYKTGNAAGKSNTRQGKIVLIISAIYDLNLEMKKNIYRDKYIGKIDLLKTGNAASKSITRLAKIGLVISAIYDLNRLENWKKNG